MAIEKRLVRPFWLLTSLIVLLIFAASVPVFAQGDGEGSQPEIVNIPGTLQSALGCPGDWAPDCEATFLDFDPVAGLWYRSFELPAGDYEYKVAINGSWDENYGGASDPGGPNIALSVPEDMTVTFVYDHSTNLIIDNVRTQFITVFGDFQDELGCAADIDPACLSTLMTDPGRDGVFSFGTYNIPPGDYAAEVSIGLAAEAVYNGADGAPVAFTVAEDGQGVLFEFDTGTNSMAITIVAPGQPFTPPGDLSLAQARWVGLDEVAWDIAHEDGQTYAIYYAANGGMAPGFTGLDGADGSIALTVDPEGFDEDTLAQFPHVADHLTLRVAEADFPTVPEALLGQVAVAAFDADGNLLDATRLQIPGVLDDLYATDEPLGLTLADGVPTLAVWAPTAHNVRLLVYADAERNTEPVAYDMARDDSGVWSVTGEAGWLGQFYLYEVTVYAPSTGQVEVNLVTDPYSMSLSMNSARSQIVDLSDAALVPAGWDETVKPDLNAPEDIVLYELHLRDFSARDETVPEEYRGTFMAFTVPDSNGMTHLRALADAGLTHIHMLPLFDIATINENPRGRSRFVLDYEALALLPPDSDQQQAELEPIRDLDAFNWGYDPWHFNVPEGSYSTDPDGAQRVLEFRAMVQALNENGLRLVMDVVYNHTNSAGQSSRSVFDRIVPGYYHRLDDNGRITTSTCCQNTATEHEMMGRFMVDSVVFWATEYRVDGFRFDLMGHHMVDDMIAVRVALDGLTLAEDGVDGSAIYVYGEGWDFGEVAGNARGLNATQINLPGTGIGTFNDRIRDSVRGGSPFGEREQQGWINGLYFQPNGLTNGDEAAQREQLLFFGDRIRAGLAGNLADFPFTSYTGEAITGADVDYNGAPTAYTQDPQEHISYVSAHDNETLWDIIMYKQLELPVTEQVRMQNLGIDLVMYGQGVPFFHAGIDMLRSKSLDRDSYNSGDWFNYLDFSYQTNNFGVGLPPASHNGDRYDVLGPILANADNVRPTPDEIMFAVEHFRESLQVRASSPLFRLQTAEDVFARLAFHNTGAEQVPGLIVMSLDDRVDGEDLDPAYELIVVVFNTAPETVEYTVADVAGLALELHPVLANSMDPVMQQSTFDAATGTFSVPGHTAAVFVLAE